MKHQIKSFAIALFTALGLTLSAVAPVQAQQTARFVVPFPAGGGTDVYVRLLAAELNKRGTLQYIVENRPGASGIIAASHVARSQPDGMTILLSSLSVLANNTVLFDKLPYDPQRDFAPVTQIAYQPAIIVARMDLPYTNIKEMVAYAKQNPGKINRGSPGAGILTNLAPLAFEMGQGFSTTHVPFSGDAPGLQALLGGNLDIHGTSITGPLQHIRAGKMRVLGVMDSRRLSQVPEAPTFKEQGFDVEATLWYSLSVPAATPRARIEQLNRDVNQVLVDPEFIEKARAVGMEPKGTTPDELARFIRAEFDRWVPILKSLNLPKQAN